MPSRNVELSGMRALRQLVAQYLSLAVMFPASHAHRIQPRGWAAFA